MIYADPFGMGGFSSKVSEKTFDWLFSSSYESFRDDGYKKDNILVALVNDISIDNLYKSGIIEANEWPLKYVDHAKILSTLIYSQPKAIFIDIKFLKERTTDATLQRATARLRSKAEKYGTKLYFAQGSADTKMSEDIQSKILSLGELSITGWKNEHKYYPLIEGGKPTAALQLYQLLCSEWPFYCKNKFKLNDFDVPMSVVWSSNSADSLFKYRESKGQGCVLPPQNAKEKFLDILSKLFKGAFKGLNNDFDEEVICAFHRHIYADEIFDVSKESKSKAKMIIKDNIIFYGADVSGISDVVNSPVLGEQPGVFYHAMAFDNLLSYGEDYRRNIDNNFITFIAWIIWVAFIIFYSKRRATYEQPVSALLSIAVLFSFTGLLIILNIYCLNATPANWVGMLGLGTVIQGFLGHVPSISTMVKSMVKWGIYLPYRLIYFAKIT